MKLGPRPPSVHLLGDAGDLQDPPRPCRIIEFPTNRQMPRRKAGTDLLDAPTDNNDSTTEMTTELMEAPEATDTKVVKVKGERLAGQELLDYVSENKANPIDEVIRGAGFYTKTTDVETNETKVTLHKPQFFLALQAAQGLEFAPAKRTYTARKNRAPVVTVVKNGNIVVGSRYSTVAGFEPGTKVAVSAEHGQIILTPYTEEGGEGEGDDELDL